MLKKFYRADARFSPILVALLDFGHFFCPFLTLGFSIWKKSENYDSLSYSGIYIICNLKNNETMQICLQFLLATHHHKLNYLMVYKN